MQPNAWLTQQEGDTHLKQAGSFHIKEKAC